MKPVTPPPTKMKPAPATVKAERYLWDRLTIIRSALDEIATVEETGLIEDVAALLGILECYQYGPMPPKVRPLVLRADSFVTMALAVCWSMMDKGRLTPKQVREVREMLEIAANRVDDSITW